MKIYKVTCSLCETYYVQAKISWDAEEAASIRFDLDHDINYADTESTCVDGTSEEVIDAYKLLMKTED